MTSVVIAAHNEQTVIGRCLAALAEPAGALDIVVVPNGCTDNTAAVARSAGARVVEIATPSKAAALNAGDEVAFGYPRVYLDADIVISGGEVKDLISVFDRIDPPKAAVPVRQLDLRGRPLAVCAYFAINSRLPVFNRSLLGRGMIALSAEARATFEKFPLMVADDLFLDSLFLEKEKQVVVDVRVVIATPKKTSDLVRRLIRVRRGNAAMRAAAREGTVHAVVRSADRLSWLRDVVLPHPWLLPAAIVYQAITVWAAIVARVFPKQEGWGRDDSTRSLASEFGKKNEQS